MLAKAGVLVRGFADASRLEVLDRDRSDRLDGLCRQIKLASQPSLVNCMGYVLLGIR